MNGGRELLQLFSCTGNHGTSPQEVSLRLPKHQPRPALHFSQPWSRNLSPHSQKYHGQAEEALALEVVNLGGH